MNPSLTLVSHALCPYVQRAAIVLHEKGVVFARREVDLAAKPDWFLAVSPLGKTPVLLVDDKAVFESAVICEYLDETLAPRLHPQDPLQRARERSWMEFGSAVLSSIAGYYNAPDSAMLDAKRAELLARFAQVESALDASGPWFAGERFGIVDAVFAPVFRYFEVFESLGQDGWFDASPRLDAWRGRLARRPSVQAGVSSEYPQRLESFLRARGSELSRRIEARYSVHA